MTSTFSSLPPELYTIIGEHLEHTDRLNLASVNSQFHTLFVPRLFSTIRFTNQQSDQDAIQSVLERYGHHARALSLDCQLYPNSSEEDHPAPEMEDLPQFTKNLLSGQTLGTAKEMMLSFKPYEDFMAVWYEWGDAQDLGEGYIAGEGDEDPEEEESENAWKRVLCQVWSSLLKNSSIRALRVLNLVPCEASVWATKEWTSFVAQLESLTVRLWGMSEANVVNGYTWFQSQLDRWFFAHAANLTSLSIQANPDCSYGSDGPSSTRLALVPDHMPKLRVLELRNCVVDPNLRDFLKSHAKAIQELVLEDCGACIIGFGIGDESEDIKVTWAAFFKAIASSQPILRRLEVVNDEEITYMEDDDSKEAVTALEDALAKGEQRLFKYVQIDEKYGFVNYDEENNFNHAKDGGDQREYDALMALVSQNAENASAVHAEKGNA